jgi:hypothetical protein
MINISRLLNSNPGYITVGNSDAPSPHPHPHHQRTLNPSRTRKLTSFLIHQTSFSLFSHDDTERRISISVLLVGFTSFPYSLLLLVPLFSIRCYHPPSDPTGSSSNSHLLASLQSYHKSTVAPCVVPKYVFYNPKPTRQFGSIRCHSCCHHL